MQREHPAQDQPHGGAQGGGGGGEGPRARPGRLARPGDLGPAGEARGEDPGAEDPVCVRGEHRGSPVQVSQWS